MKLSVALFLSLIGSSAGANVRGSNKKTRSNNGKSLNNNKRVLEEFDESIDELYTESEKYFEMNEESEESLDPMWTPESDNDSDVGEDLNAMGADEKYFEMMNVSSEDMDPSEMMHEINMQQEEMERMQDEIDAMENKFESFSKGDQFESFNNQFETFPPAQKTEMDGFGAMGADSFFGVNSAEEADKVHCNGEMYCTNGGECPVGGEKGCKCGVGYSGLHCENMAEEDWDDDEEDDDNGEEVDEFMDRVRHLLGF